MTEKLKRMQMILVIAATLIFFADISLFASSLIKLDYVKFVLGLIIPTILVVLSFQVEKELKLNTASSIIYDLGFASYMVSVLGTLSLFDGHQVLSIGNFDLSKVTVFFLFGVLISVISYVIQKKKKYLNLALASLVITLEGLFNDIALVYVDSSHSVFYGFFAGLTCLLCINLFVKKESLSFFTLINLLHTLFMIFNTKFTEIIGLELIASILNLAVLIINVRRQDNLGFDFLSFMTIGIELFMIWMSLLYASFDGASLVLVAVVALIDMLFSVLDIGNNRKQALGFKIVLDIFTLMLMINTIFTKEAVIPVVIIVLLSSLVSTYALKSDKYEQYLLPFKLIVSIIALLSLIAEYITITSSEVIAIINVSAIIGLVLSNNKTFKNMFLTVIGITLFASFQYPYDFFDYFLISGMMLVNYFVVSKTYKEKPIFGNILLATLAIYVCAKLDVFNEHFLYLAMAAVFGIVHILDKNDNEKIISFIAIIYSLLAFITRLTLSQSLIDSALLVVLFFALSYVLLRFKGGEVVFIVGLVVLALNTYVAYDIVVTLTFVSELIITLFLSYKNRENIFRTALLLIITTGIYLLTQLDNVPSFVYMLIAGLAAIYAIFLSIKKYLKNDYEREQKENEEKIKEKEHVHEEKEVEYIYCTSCGTRLEKDSSFCTNCGEKVEK